MTNGILICGFELGYSFFMPWLWYIFRHAIPDGSRMRCVGSGHGSLDRPPDYFSIHLPAESGRLLFLARLVASGMTFRDPCLLRVTNSYFWPTSNNWHLYYRLRQSYGDQRLIHEAPGHLFLDYETEDLATFLHVAMLFGWDAQMNFASPYFAADLSHDGFLDVHSDKSCPETLAKFRKGIEGAKLTFKVRRYGA
jgi:hypothetical protein